MSEQKNYGNQFRFSLYQENDLLGEKFFSADDFNPMARYSVNIRELVPSIIQRFQKLMSKRNADYKIDVGNNKVYDSLEEYKKRLEAVGGVTPNKLTPPQIKEIDILDPKGNVIKTMRGVECKFCLHINNNLIVERLFYVDKYNPAIRFSTDLTATVADVTDDIFNLIKRNDVNNIWDDFSIINAYGFPHINNVRELGRDQRELYLKNITNGAFIRSVKSQYKKPSTDEATSVAE